MEATVSALLNQQINKEFYSAYLYLDIANFMRLRVWTALQTGIRSSKGGAGPCDAVFTSICTTTASR